MKTIPEKIKIGAIIISGISYYVAGTIYLISTLSHSSGLSLNLM